MKPRHARTVAVASPDAAFRLEIVRTLKVAGWVPDAVDTGAAALAVVEDQEFRLLLLDAALPDLDAEELVELVTQVRPDMGVVMMDRDTGRFWSPPRSAPSRDVSRALRLLRNASGLGEGVDSFFRGQAQPSDPTGPRPELTSGTAGAGRTLVGEAAVEALPGMIGMSAEIHEVYRLVRLVSGRRTPVLITGETGTGKELVARAVHASSPRRSQPFVVVNCAAIPEELLEAELFGFERGAFTGAVQARPGRIRAAESGTLFLDEVGEMPPAMQAKLLRFLQEGEVQRLGSSEVSHIDTRVVAATNVRLEQQVAKGEFRTDLFYRLTVFPIHIAPLRERPDDILPLAEHFLGRLCQEARVPFKMIARHTADSLLQQSWPGNVRELEHAIERAFILSEDDPELLPGPLAPSAIELSGPIPTLASV